MHSINSLGMKCKKACRILLAISAIMCIFSLPASAQDREYKIEAAFLYSFFNYITWPGYESPQALRDPVICIYEGDPILPYLDYVSNKMIKERMLSIRVLSDSQSTAGCHILFMQHQIPYYRLHLVDDSTLVVFKPDDPLDRGGMIVLTEDEDHIAIKINLNQLERNGFQVSSRLLDIAHKIR